ncbi:hypothetical protein M9Y82_09050 [Leptospira weilii]|uniref:hypothetical protein n=1 Tax=Leptospira weilii TaxID=28184 RepID=UPI0002486409|nr:hypothetical protein [Leptospira weilii]MCL8266792.1 hypothetical protein [Leptospira weilii]
MAVITLQDSPLRSLASCTTKLHGVFLVPPETQQVSSYGSKPIMDSGRVLSLLTEAQNALTRKLRILLKSFLIVGFD